MHRNTIFVSNNLTIVGEIKEKDRKELSDNMKKFDEESSAALREGIATGKDVYLSNKLTLVGEEFYFPGPKK
jgi:hypothetical protein